MSYFKVEDQDSQFLDQVGTVFVYAIKQMMQH